MLTCICLATRYPSAVPVRNVRATTVAQACTEMFSNTNFPYQILTDQGAQFTEKLFKEVMSILSIEHKRTTPYHPQCNGAVERLNGTVKRALNKQLHAGSDWVDALPLVMHAIRLHDHDGLGVSPYELVHGQHGRTELDLLYAGWREKKFEALNLSDFATNLGDSLLALREIGAANQVQAIRNRKVKYDKNSVPRSYAVGDLILCRFPGLQASLSKSWEGPYEVLERLSTVNYRVRQVDARGKGKVIHINASKAYNDRSTPVRRLTVLADEPIPEQNIEVQEALGRCQGDLDKVLGMFPGVFSDTPGNGNIVEVSLTVKEDVLCLYLRISFLKG